MNLLFVDTETGGLDPSKHSLLQIGLVAYDGRIKDTLKINVKSDVYNITAESIHFNNFDLPTLIGGTPECEIPIAIKSFIDRNFAETPIMAGFNLSLDKYMIRNLLAKYFVNLDDLVGYHHLDVMALLWTLHFKGRIPIEACSSSGAFRHFEIPNDHPHDALDDAVATCLLFEKLFAIIS